MHARTPRRGRGLVAAAATLGLLGLPLLATTPADAAGKDKVPAVKVMTRNIYLGANILRPIAAVQQAQQEHPGDPYAQLDAFANANDDTSDIVDETDFAVRAQLLAEELVSNKPDLVGLQEVALWRTGPMDNPNDPAVFLEPNAETEKYDFLAMLLAATNTLGGDSGVKYKVVSMAQRADVEGPAYDGAILFDATDKRDVRLTMHDVILMRVGGAVEPVKGTKGNEIYDANLSFDLDESSEDNNVIMFSRGYQWMDFTAGDRRFRFINTHLEAFGSDLAYAQAEELVTGPGAYKGRTILVCDCNSDPADESVKNGEEQPHWGPYFRIVRAGFNDTWTQKYAPEDGFTSGLGERVMDDTDANEDGIEDGFDHRIDLVMARTKAGDKLPVLSGDVVGEELADRDESGLWPSDHAGVVMKLRLR